MKEDWELKSLKTVVNQFIVPQRDRPKKFDGNIPWCRIEDLDGIYLSKSKSGLCVSQELVESMPLRVYPKGTVIVSCSADLGRCAIIANPLITNQTFIGLVPSEDIDSLYLYYLMGSRASQLNKMASGATIKYLSKKKFQQLEIPIPPLSEQKQIVKILDQAFEAIDQAKANIEKNVANAKELFQSKLNEVFSRKGDGWEEKALGEMSKIMYGYTSKVVEDGNTQYVRITDIQDGSINWNSVPRVNISDKDKIKYKLAKGDIVFARTGATTGKSYLMEEPPNSVFASYLIRVQCEKSILEPSFLYLFFQSGYYWKIVESGISGSAQGGFNASKLGDMIIHFPKDKVIQLKYVDLIKSIRKPIQELEGRYLTELSNLQELKKSILKKAFSGELTNTE